ncbi:MAG: hypothetical protein MUP76_08645 [Acidimicrobiia bacterium]|nr:hypothetical protein [Acidimicrobiia bacterium]
MRRVTPLILALALTAAAAGCGDDASVLGDGVGTSAAPTATEAPATTEATTTTLPPATTEATTTTTVAPPTTADITYEVDESNFFPAPLPGSDQAAGSGCVVPGGSSTLTDGIWFGFVEAFTPGTLTFDLACFWTGDVAEAKAIEDGEEAFDFYIRNQNPNTRQVPLAGSARVWFIDASSGGVTMPTEIPVTTWPHPDSFLMCPGDYCSVWLYVNDGKATALVEQYLP